MALHSLAGGFWCGRPWGPLAGIWVDSLGGLDGQWLGLCFLFLVCGFGSTAALFLVASVVLARGWLLAVYCPS